MTSSAAGGLGVGADGPAVQAGGSVDRLGQRGDVARGREHSRLWRHDLAQPAAGEAGHGGAAGHRLGRDQSVGLVPDRGHDGHRRRPQQRGQVGAAHVPGVADLRAEAGRHLALEVAAVLHRAGQHQRHAREAAGVGREVGRLLRDDAPAPHGGTAPGTGRPRREVEAVGHHVALDRVPPGVRRPLADRHEAGRVLTERDGRLEQGERRRVQRREHGDAHCRGHRDRQVVEAVVVHHVVLLRPVPREREHQVEVGVVVREPVRPRRELVRHRRRARLHPRQGQQAHGQRGVGPRTREQGDLVASR